MSCYLISRFTIPFVCYIIKFDIYLSIFFGFLHLYIPVIRDLQVLAASTNTFTVGWSIGAVVHQTMVTATLRDTCKFATFTCTVDRIVERQQCTFTSLASNAEYTTNFVGCASLAPGQTTADCTKPVSIVVRTLPAGI